MIARVLAVFLLCSGLLVASQAQQGQPVGPNPPVGLFTTTGALKGNGSGSVSQAACSDLSNSGAACQIGTPVSVANGGTGDTGTAWTPYTPTAVCSTSGTITTYTASGRYKTIGKTVFLEVQITITTLGTCQGTLELSTPVAVNATGNIYMLAAENSSTATATPAVAVGNTNTINFPFAVAPAANIYYAAGVYEST